MQRIADLTKQLDVAQKTMSSLENINVSATRRQIQQTDVFCQTSQFLTKRLI